MSCRNRSYCARAKATGYLIVALLTSGMPPPARARAVASGPAGQDFRL